jgi:hypothetical protein
MATNKITDSQSEDQSRAVVLETVMGFWVKLPGSVPGLSAVSETVEEYWYD